MTLAHHRHYHEMKALVRERYPAAFPAKDATPVPLALGIGVDLVTALLGEVAPWKVSLFLRVWTERPKYHRAVSEIGWRVGLDGAVTTPVSDQHRAYAQAQLDKLASKPEPGA